jgi:hypothetical protein
MRGAGTASAIALIVLGCGRAGVDAVGSSSAVVSSGQLATRAAPVARIYAPNSPFNRPIPAGAAIDPRSARFVRGLTRAARHGFLVAIRQWTVPVYVATAGTRRYQVSLTASWAPSSALTGVPIPDAASPDPSGDAHLAILDRESGCEYDFWQARKRGQSWSATWGNSVRLSGSGVFPHGLSARGSGFALVAGLIRPSELAQGRIDHALVFSYPYTSAAGFVAPATESDGTNPHSYALPEGARLQLDPSLDISSLPRYERTIARALQRYGMYLGDTGGSNVSLYALNSQSYRQNPYTGLLPDGTFADLPDIPINRFRVIKLGRVIDDGNATLVPSGCGAFR